MLACFLVCHNHAPKKEEARRTPENARDADTRHVSHYHTPTQTVERMRTFSNDPRKQSVSRNSKLRDRHELMGVELLPLRRSRLSVSDVDQDM